MSNACSLDLTARKRAETGYTDELAEQFALEAGGLAPRPNEQKDETNERGVFVRQPNSFIRPFGDREGDLKAEANRFAIYWAHGCNWSNRPVIARDLLGLENVIADQTTTHTGETNRYGHGFADGTGMCMAGWTERAVRWYEELKKDGSHPRCEVTDELLSQIDILVDGRFIEEFKDITLKFRGSRNQRILDLNESRKEGRLLFWDGIAR